VQVIGEAVLGITSRSLNDVITWWATSSDGQGGYVYTAPSILKGKWIEEETLSKGSKGVDIVSDSAVILDQDVSVGDYLTLGDLTSVSDPTTLDNAFRIQKFRRYTDLRGLEMVREAVL